MINPLRTRLDPKVRKKQILEAAIRVAEKKGYAQMRQADIAEEAGVSHGLITNYFNTLRQLRRTVMRHAIKTGNHKVIAQGIANGDSVACRAPEHVRINAVRQMMASSE